MLCVRNSYTVDDAEMRLLMSSLCRFAPYVSPSSSLCFYMWCPVTPASFLPSFPFPFFSLSSLSLSLSLSPSDKAQCPSDASASSILSRPNSRTQGLCVYLDASVCACGKRGKRGTLSLQDYQLHIEGECTLGTKAHFLTVRQKPSGHQLHLVTHTSMPM